MRRRIATWSIALAIIFFTTPARPADAAADQPAGTIAFSSVGPRGWDLFVTEVKTRKTRRLTDHPALDYNAAFAPDGLQVAFVSERDGNLELYSILIDGSGLKRLTNEFALDDHPAWSPDGKQIAFVNTRQPAEKPVSHGMVSMS